MFSHRIHFPVSYNRPLPKKQAQPFLSFIAPTHGGWGAWVPHGWPNNPCSGPSNTASRSCNNPPPEHGGRGCSGPNTATVDCNECMYNNGECDHRCINIVGGKRCECHPGYKSNPEDSNRCTGKIFLPLDMPFVKDGAYFCFCAFRDTDGFLWVVPTNTGTCVV